MTTTLARGSTIALAGLAGLHLLVAAGAVPPAHVGGGRYPDATTARAVEAGAAALTAGAAWVTAARGGWVGRPGPRVQRPLLWAMTGVFALSTAGSLASRSVVERTALAGLAAGLTLASGVLAATTRGASGARPRRSLGSPS